MTDNESVKFFLRLVQEKHEQVKVHLNELFQVIATDDHAIKVRANSALHNSCTELSKILSSSDKPHWLRDLTSETSVYDQNPEHSQYNYRLLDTIARHRNDTITHSWSFNESSVETDYNFDSLYNRFKEESNLPSLFASMISVLEQMLSSGEIDSLTALRNLEQLISVIKQNQDGSYFSVMASWEFITGFTKNLIWQELSDLPGVKQLKNAFEKTINEMDIELEKLHTTIAEEMKNKYKTSINSLKYRIKADNLIEDNNDITK